MNKKNCPFCGEEIAAKAKKCRFCGEWLEPEAAHLKEAAPSSTAPSLSTYSANKVKNIADDNTFIEPTQIDNQTSNNFTHADLEETYNPKVSFFKAYFINPFICRYADFKGYTTRKSFWLTYVATFILSVGLCGLFLLLSSSGTVGTMAGSIISGLIGLALVVPGLALCARRLRDAGKNPWLILLGCIPVIGTIILLILFCQESKYEDTEEKGHWQMPDWIVTGVCVILLVLGIVFSLNSIGSNKYSYDLGEFDDSNNIEIVEEVSDASENESAVSAIYHLTGLIDGKYSIDMTLDFGNSTGTYYYVKNGSENPLNLIITKSEENGDIVIEEYNDNDVQTGRFEGKVNDDGEIRGWFTNYKGKEMPFYLKIDPEYSGNVELGITDGYNSIKGYVIADNGKEYPFRIDFEWKGNRIYNASYHNINYKAETTLPEAEIFDGEYSFTGKIGRDVLKIRFSTDYPYKGTMVVGGNVSEIRMEL